MCQNSGEDSYLTKQFGLEIVVNRKSTKNLLKILTQNSEKSLQSIDKQVLESVLKKSLNLSIIGLGLYDNSVLSLIGRYCNHLKSLKLYDMSSDVNILDFFRMYGHKLEELELHKNCDEDYDYEEFKQILIFCPNLKRIYFFQLKYCLDNDKEFLPKLENIEFFRITFEDMNALKIMSDKYSQTMKSLDVELYEETTEELKTCIECIARFENLKELKLSIVTMGLEEPIDDCLSLIGQKCNKLLKLDLEISPLVSISNRFFNIFSGFKNLENLKINISPKIEMKGSVECFENCKQLKKLNIGCYYGKLREDFFANIASFVPKLQSLRIRTEKPFSDSFINSFLSMKNIQKVEHYLVYGNNTNWYFGKSVSEVMLSPNGMNVKHINDNCVQLFRTTNPILDGIQVTKQSLDVLSQLKDILKD